MLQLDNRTSFEAERAVLLDLDGSEIWVVAVKATFEIQGSDLVLADIQEPVCMADEYLGEPGRSSMKYENELVFKKPGTDVVINGQVYAPKGRPVTRLDASIRIGTLSKIIRVFGDRLWEESLTGLSISSPKPFIKIPFIYERAFGGEDLTNNDPKKQSAEYQNPIGTGFAMTKAALKGRSLPNFEDPENIINSWNSRPKPTGIGFICKHWQPRRRYTGTCDQNYMENRLPLYPLDFDLRFFLGANPDYVFTPHLRGGEQIELDYFTANGGLSFKLPRIVLGFRTLMSGKWIDHHSTLGTVVIEPDRKRVLLTWQTHLPCHRKTFELEKTRIFEKKVL